MQGGVQQMKEYRTAKKPGVGVDERQGENEPHTPPPPKKLKTKQKIKRVKKRRLHPADTKGGG